MSVELFFCIICMVALFLTACKTYEQEPLITKVQTICVIAYVVNAVFVYSFIPTSPSYTAIALSLLFLTITLMGIVGCNIVIACKDTKLAYLQVIFYMTPTAFIAWACYRIYDYLEINRPLISYIN